jgi:adenylyltransferase/sulfurtransferase
MSTGIDFWRQLDIVSPDHLARIQATVIGIGGIGSPLTLALAKMGVPRITVYDPDSVETHNLPNQMFRISDLGKPKVEGIRTICQEFAGVTVETRVEAFESQILAGVVLSGVDTMTARKKIWERIRYNPLVPLYIEGRMAGEIARILTVNPCDPDHVSWYERTLYSDEQAVQLPCTARAIIYSVFVLAGLMTNQVKRFARAEVLRKEIIVDLANLHLTSQ